MPIILYLVVVAVVSLKEQIRMWNWGYNDEHIIRLREDIDKIGRFHLEMPGRGRLKAINRGVCILEGAKHRHQVNMLAAELGRFFSKFLEILYPIMRS